jgi:ubiquinone/menaquinone biosynthesis C-methylase UbiE
VLRGTELGLLACPRCHGELRRDGDSLGCVRCAAGYTVVDGVPVLVPGRLSDQHVHQREYFDAEFAGYDEYTVENWRLSYIERIFESTGVTNGRAPYLDVGVGGSGTTVIEAARRGVPAVGCDLSVPGILAARRFAESEGVSELIEFVVCAAEALPFADASIGSASAVAVLEHLDDDEAAVTELARVLRPGALVWFTVPHAFRYIPPPIWPLYWWHDRRIGHKRHYDEHRLVALCERRGLEHVQTEFSGHSIKFLQLALTALPPVRRPQSRLWWRLERRDRSRAARPLGAVQLSAVFRKP